MNQYRLAAFDFDGTLADSFEWFLSVMGEVANRYKFRRMDLADLDSLRGLNTRQLLARLRLPSWKVPFVARHVRALQSRDIEKIQLFDGVREMLNGLVENGVKIAVVSSNSEQNVRTVLGFKYAALMTYYGCGASLLGKKPKLKSAMRASGVSPQDAIYIGDEVRDIQAAKSVGMASGAVAWGYAKLQTLEAEQPTELFLEPAELVPRIRGLPTHREVGLPGI